MRAVFFLLVLANLGFAAWAAWYSGADTPTRALVSPGPGLEIYADSEEQESEPSNVRGSGSVPDGSVTDGGGETGNAVAVLAECISIGPLPNRVDVEDTLRALAGSGFQARQRIAQGEVWLGHWVYIDAIPTQGEAAAIVDVLAENGISEAYVIADGNNGSIVSLGVFSQQQRARQRFADAEALGFAPAVVDRSQPGEVFWLDVTARDAEPFAVAELDALNLRAGLQQERCAAARGN